MDSEGKGRLSINPDDLEILGDQFDAPTIFVDGAHGFLASDTVAKWNLFQIVQEIQKPGEQNAVLRKRIVARLVMSPSVAVSIGRWLIQQSGLETTSETEAQEK